MNTWFKHYARLLLLLLPVVSYADDTLTVHHSHSQYYFSQYQQIDAEILTDEIAFADVVDVFNTVKSVADTPKQIAKLAILKSKPSTLTANLSAKALVDGYIVTTDKFIKQVRQHTANNEILFQTFMAFVFGHELAHFANDDYATLHDLKQNKMDKVTKHEAIKQLELKADATGFIYAALAGYKVGLLLEEHGQNHSIFEMLVEKIELDQQFDNVDKTHADAEKRAMRVILAWEKVTEKYPFYEYGVRFATFDQCQDALLFFNQFLPVYAGKELQNNIGLCHLKLAKLEMEKHIAYFYWMPGILDTEVESIIKMGGVDNTGLTSLRSAKLDSSLAKGNLESAVENFAKAIRSAPNYFASYINLAISYLYLGKPRQAQYHLLNGLDEYHALSETQRKKQGEKIKIYMQMLLLLARYESEIVNSNPWRNVVDELIELLQTSNVQLPEIIFNIARLLQIRARTGEAQAYWQQITQAPQRSQLPKPILEIACSERSGIDSSKCISTEVTLPNSQQWSWIFSLTNDSLYDQELIHQQVKTKWKPLLLTENLQYETISIYQSADKNWEILAFGVDIYPTLFINRQPNDIVANIDKYCPVTPLKKALSQHDIYLCQCNIANCRNWAAKVVNGKIAEVWRKM